MQTITIKTDTVANAKFLAAFLKTVNMVKSVIIEKRSDKNTVAQEPEEEYNWINPSRPATEEEFEQMILEAEREIEVGLGIPSNVARKETLEELKEWRKKKNL